MRPRIVVYCCANSVVVPEEHVEKAMSEKGVDIQIVRLPCTGRTDPLYILRAIEDGAHMAMIVGCPEGQCQFLEGNLRAKMRVRYANRLLSEAGLGGDRVRMYNMSPAESDFFPAALAEVIDKARKLGPWLASGR
jgi:F420-non-reducing hydrogenase iron-sulfur subunit